MQNFSRFCWFFMANCYNLSNEFIKNCYYLIKIKQSLKTALMYVKWKFKGFYYGFGTID